MSMQILRVLTIVLGNRDFTCRFLWCLGDFVYRDDAVMMGIAEPAMSHHGENLPQTLLNTTFFHTPFNQAVSVCGFRNHDPPNKGPTQKHKQLVRVFGFCQCMMVIRIQEAFRFSRVFVRCA